MILLLSLNYGLVVGTTVEGIGIGRIAGQEISYDTSEVPLPKRKGLLSSTSSPMRHSP